MHNNSTWQGYYNIPNGDFFPTIYGYNCLTCGIWISQGSLHQCNFQGVSITPVMYTCQQCGLFVTYGHFCSPINTKAYMNCLKCGLLQEIGSDHFNNCPNELKQTINEILKTLQDISAKLDKS